MSKSALPAALLLALCAPTALAFPPCPSLNLDIVQAYDPVRAPRKNVPAWFISAYAMDGNPIVTSAIEQPVDSVKKTYGWDSGTCRTGDRLPILGPNAGTAHLNATPTRAADHAGYGTLVLPDIRVDDPGQTLRYTLDFTVDGHPLATTGDWFDVAELEMQWSNPLSTTHPHRISALYRVRKRMTTSEHVEVQVIESRRAWPSEPGNPSQVIESIVARFSADPGHDVPVKLRWSQRTRALPGDSFVPDPYVTESVGEPASKAGEASIDMSMSIIRNDVGDGQGTLAQPTVDTTIEVIGTNGQVVYQRQLHDQWAANLVMGLLDYTAQSELPYAGNEPTLGQMTLDGETD